MLYVSWYRFAFANTLWVAVCPPPPRMLATGVYPAELGHLAKPARSFGKIRRLHSVVNMSGADLLAYCGQKLMHMSNGLPVGDLSDYSILLESLHKIRYTILSHRNDQVPINRLPVEILMLICKLTLPPDSEVAAPNNNRVFYAMKLTHVCRHWRLVFVSSPVLWTNFRVVETAPKFVAECLQRSGTSPIHVSFGWYSRDPDYKSPSTSVFEDDGSVADDSGDASDGGGSVVDEDNTSQISSSDSDDSDDGAASHSTLSIYPDYRDKNRPWTKYIKEAQSYHHLIQHSHRIATLDISFSPPGDDEDEDNPFACGLLIYPFPALQTLKLRHFLGSDGSDGSIPKVILDEHIATVKSLLLANILPTQIVDLSLNITSLTLKTNNLHTPIDTGSFLRFLGKNRNLRSLTLHNYKFLPVPESTTPVALNYLRQLDVSSESLAILRHLTTLPLGPQSLLKFGGEHRHLWLSAENSAAGTSISVSSLLLGVDPDPDEFLSLISGIFGSGWEEATRVIVAIPVGGWEREFVDRFLGRLTRLNDLFMDCYHDRVDPWFDSLAASKECCPKLGRVRLDIAPEYCPNVLMSVRKLVKRRAEDGVPLEAVEQVGLPLSTVAIWNNLYDRWRIGDYLKAGGS
ncbi:hypothetical protein BDM02DRAFT_575214 [Thelephora ganbajun]|uniref:Uncharacterized protein n=1 Tax=Thelephora ganbajun TaxID=370292 RepID=A0ACB6Z781_THEGA|nr:hypothetical protein BDM02DRAFT_575214 [Thelephora ganbajun]